MFAYFFLGGVTYAISRALSAPPETAIGVAAGSGLGRVRGMPWKHVQTL